MRKIAIITAMQSEYEAIKSLYSFSGNNLEARTNIYEKEILLLKSGIGKVNAALTANKASQLKADLVISTGLAGGVDNCLKQGDIVLADKVCYHDVDCGEGNTIGQVQDLPLYFTSPTNLIQQISQQAEHFKIGLTVTGDQFLTAPERLKQIKKDFPTALAVDMESAAVAQTCYINNIPFISLRIISDVVGQKQQIEHYNNFWQNVPHLATQMIDMAIKAI